MRATSILVQVLLVGWLGSVVILWPLPWNNQYLDENRATIREIVVLKSKQQGQNLSDNEISRLTQENIDIQKRTLWSRWLLRLLAVLVAISSAILYLLRAKNQWLGCIAATSLLYLGFWIEPIANANSLLPIVVHGSAVFNKGTFTGILEFVFLDVVLPGLHALAIPFLVWAIVTTGKAQKASA